MAKRFNIKTDFAATAEFNLVDVHRDTITTSICQAATHLRERLRQSKQSEIKACIFSGGYGSDLSLQMLFNYFSKITLVGDSLAILKKAAGLQGLAISDRLELVGDTDLTGVHHHLESLLSSGLPKEADLTPLIQVARTASWEDLPEQVDFNASICFLSQLVVEIVEGVGENHDQFVNLIQAVRLRHLQLMLEQLKPGGIGLLAIDFVSSETLPALPSLKGEELERTLRAAIDNNNFFHGLNPQVFLQLFEKDLRSQLSGFQFCKPWVWKTAEQAYAVTAVMFQKKS